MAVSQSRRRMRQKSKEQASRCTLADSKFFIARCHRFASWPKFAKHLDALPRANSPASHFESAVDAIVIGNIVALENGCGKIRGSCERDPRASIAPPCAATSQRTASRIFTKKRPGILSRPRRCRWTRA